MSSARSVESVLEERHDLPAGKVAVRHGHGVLEVEECIEWRAAYNVCSSLSLALHGFVVQCLFDGCSKAGDSNSTRNKAGIRRRWLGCGARRESLRGWVAFLGFTEQSLLLKRAHSLADQHAESAHRRWLFLIKRCAAPVPASPGCGR